MATSDYVIVGGGSSGAVLAARLSEQSDTSVLLLEAGPVAPDPQADRLGAVDFSHTGRDWGFEARTTGASVQPYPQGKTLGGGSAVNGGTALRGMPSDYDAWASRNWSWEALAPCFRRLEDDPIGGELHGTGGPIPIRRELQEDLVEPQQQFLQAATDDGLEWVDDHNDGTSSGIGASPQNVVDGVRVSTALAYLRPADGRRNLSVMGGAHGCRVLLERGRAVGVEYRDAGGQLHTARGRRVVLCAGAFNTPTLLMRSGVGAARDLESVGVTCEMDLPGVGRNLMDHVGAFVFVVPPQGTVTTDIVQHQLLVRTSTQDSPLLNDLQMGMLNHWDLSQNPPLAEACGAELVWGLTAGIQAPRSRGRVWLRSADPSLPPVIDLNLLDDPVDIRQLVQGVRRCLQLAQHEAFAGRFQGFGALADPAMLDDEVAADDYVRQFAFPWYHASGTCRMGPDPDGGDVVDDTGRVHGVDRLWVFDASILPVIPRANTNLTCIAIGERAAELLR